MDNLKQELIEILTYFNEGLKDVEAGSGEVQPMQKRIEIALRQVKNLTIPVVNGWLSFADKKPKPLQPIQVRDKPIIKEYKLTIADMVFCKWDNKEWKPK